MFKLAFIAAVIVAAAARRDYLVNEPSNSLLQSTSYSPALTGAYYGHGPDPNLHMCCSPDVCSVNNIYGFFVILIFVFPSLFSLSTSLKELVSTKAATNVSPTFVFTCWLFWNALTSVTAILSEHRSSNTVSKPVSDLISATT